MRVACCAFSACSAVVGWATARKRELNAWAKSRGAVAHASGAQQAILPTLRQFALSSRRRIGLDVVRGLQHVVGDLVAGREPHYLVMLMHVADHLLEGVGHEGTAAERGMHQSVD